MYGADVLRRSKPIAAIGGAAPATSAPYGAADAESMPSPATAMPPRGPAQTFAQMRASGMARPAPPSPVPQGTRDAIAGAVANPSAYGAPQAMDTFQRLNAALGEQFGIARRNVDSQAARRGLFDSSVAVGQLGDLGVQQARAQTDLAGQIAEQQARAAQADRASANAQSLDLARLDQQGGQFDTQQELARLLGLGGLDLQNRSLDQNASQFGQGLEMDRRRMDLQGEQFGQGMALDRERLTQQGGQFDKSQQLTRDQMLQQLAMFFGLPSGTDIGATVDLTPTAPVYSSEGALYNPRRATSMPRYI